MRKLLVTTVVSMALAGCGTNQSDRVVGGAGVGALAGAAVGAVTDVSVGHGLLLGAAAGAITAAITREDQVNLGAPPWSGNRRSASATPARQHATDGQAQTVRKIQTQLKERGLYAGPIDGIAGPRTAAAIRTYQRERNLEIDGRASPSLAAQLDADA